MIKIKKINENDILDVHSIEQECFLEFSWNEHMLREELSQSGNIFLGAFFEHLLVGYIVARSVEEEGEILRLAVSPKFQNQKIGKKLALACIETFFSNGVEKIFLEVSDINIFPIKLYENIGFKKLYSRPNYYEDGSRAIIYRLEKLN